jgi:hypothetical protein
MKADKRVEFTNENYQKILRWKEGAKWKDIGMNQQEGNRFLRKTVSELVEENKQLRSENEALKEGKKPVEVPS